MPLHRAALALRLSRHIAGMAGDLCYSCRAPHGHGQRHGLVWRDRRVKVKQGRVEPKPIQGQPFSRAMAVTRQGRHRNNAAQGRKALPSRTDQDVKAFQAYPNLIRPASARAGQSNPLQAEPRVTPTHPLRDEATLRAIRLTFGPTDPAPAAETRPFTFDGAGPDLRTRLSRLSRHALHRVAAQMLVWGLLALAFPAGAAKALMFHLNGGDLAAWD